MYGVVKSVDRELEIMDGTHELPQYDTWSASYRLYQSLKFWPEGTIYVSVVDPGVGTERRACVAKVKGGYYVVSPDNGSLTHIKRFMGIEAVRQIDESVNRLRGKGTEEVAIFHGRDLFGYTAARLASGIIDFEGVGPEYPVDEIIEHEIAEPVIRPGSAEGIFEINDPNFGNLWTNIPLSDFKKAGFKYADTVHTVITHGGRTVFERDLLFADSFGRAREGEPMIYNNELVRIAMAVNRGNLCRDFGLDFGPDWKVSFTK